MGASSSPGTAGRPSLLEKLKQRARDLQVQTYTLLLACRDPRTPWYAKALALLVVAYALSPVDLIPDFIPVLGYLDDLLIVPAGIALSLRMIPAQVMAEAREKAKQHLAGVGDSRLGRLGAAIVILVWLILLVLVVFWILRLIKR
jgi:uncharacterized membrane protein YkvA (DUF1232 family)